MGPHLQGLRTSRLGFTYSNIANIAGRFIQIIFACVVIGFYGTDLHRAHKVHKYSDGRWVYGVAVGSMAAISALLMAIIGLVAQYRVIALMFIWEWLIVIFWAALSGLFGIMYLDENPEMDGGIERMKTAVAFDLFNMCLWIISAGIGLYVYLRSPRKTLHTGRAEL